MLYRTLQAHWRSFLGDISGDGGGGAELPRFIVDEVEAYLKCGILAHGFLRVLCQSCGSSLNLNVHLHTILVDGVYQIGPNGDPVFRRVPPPSDEEVAHIVETVHRKITAKLAATDGFEVGTTNQDGPLLAALANASVAGLIATGPRAGSRVVPERFAQRKYARAAMSSRRTSTKGIRNRSANFRGGTMESTQSAGPLWTRSLSHSTFSPSLARRRTRPETSSWTSSATSPGAR